MEEPEVTGGDEAAIAVFLAACGQPAGRRRFRPGGSWIRQDGPALQVAAEKRTADKELVLEAVRQNESALEFAAQELTADPELVLDDGRQSRRRCRAARCRGHSWRCTLRASSAHP